MAVIIFGGAIYFAFFLVFVWPLQTLLNSLVDRVLKSRRIFNLILANVFGLAFFTTVGAYLEHDHEGPQWKTGFFLSAPTQLLLFIYHLMKIKAGPEITPAALPSNLHQTNDSLGRHAETGQATTPLPDQPQANIVSLKNLLRVVTLGGAYLYPVVINELSYFTDTFRYWKPTSLIEGTAVFYLPGLILLQVYPYKNIAARFAALAFYVPISVILMLVVYTITTGLGYYTHPGHTYDPDHPEIPYVNGHPVKSH